MTPIPWPLIGSVSTDSSSMGKNKVNGGSESNTVSSAHSPSSELVSGVSVPMTTLSSSMGKNKVNGGSRSNTVSIAHSLMTELVSWVSAFWGSVASGTLSGRKISKTEPNTNADQTHDERGNGNSSHR